MFSEFPLHKRLLKALGDLHLREPTPVQEAAIPLALEGNDLRIAAETGSGKTLAYLLPALNQLLAKPHFGEGVRALILVPTRELAQQVAATCSELAKHTSLSIRLVSGGEHFGEQMEALGQEPAIVVSTPGRLIKQLKLGAADLADLEVLIIDEADRMLDMGFADDVKAIVEQCGTERQTILCSATLGHKGLHGLAGEALRNPEVVSLGRVREPHSLIRHQIVLADDLEHKQRLLLWLLSHEPFEKALVFTNSRVGADRLGGFLVHHKQRVGVLHGEMEQAGRNRVMKLFREGAFKVLIATDVAARGIDVEGIDCVINFDMARRGDNYIHRTGRTGRAGKEGTAISLISPQEWNLMAGIERYLRHHFERRTIKELKGVYSGPKKLKASGKAAGSKKKKARGKSGGTNKPARAKREKARQGRAAGA